MMCSLVTLTVLLHLKGESGKILAKYLLDTVSEHSLGNRLQEVKKDYQIQEDIDKKH